MKPGLKGGVVMFDLFPFLKDWRPSDIDKEKERACDTIDPVDGFAMKNPLLLLAMYQNMNKL